MSRLFFPPLLVLFVLAFYRVPLLGRSCLTYCVVMNSGGKGNTIHIEEKTLGEENPVSWKGHAEILDGSSLAVYYALKNDEPTRRVIYQSTDDASLHDHEPGAGGKYLLLDWIMPYLTSPLCRRKDISRGRHGKVPPRRHRRW